VIVGELRSNASPRSAVQKSDLDEEWLIDFFDRVSLFRQSSGKRIQSDRSTLIFFDDGQHQLAVDLIEPVFVYFQHLECGLRTRFIDVPRAAHLREVTDAPQQPVRDARCSTRAASQLRCAFTVNRDA